MRDQAKFIESLQSENAALRQRIAEFERVQADRVSADIERKQSEAALRESEQRYRELFEGLNDAVMVFSPTQGFIDCNAMTLQQLGYTRDEFLGLTPVDIIHPDFQALGANNRRQVQAGQATLVESRHCRKDGSSFPVEVNSRPINYRGEHAILSVVRDITERKRVEEALHEKEARLREVLENSLDASYKRNLRTNTYDYISPVFARVSGYAADEMQALPLATPVNLMHPDDRAEVERVMAMALSGAASTAHQIDYRFQHKDGQYRWLHDQFSVMRDAHGQPVVLIGSISDITDRKHMEEALHESVARAQALLHAVPDLMFRMDRQGVFLDYKADVNDLYAQTDPTLIGKRNRDVTPPEFADLIDAQIHTTLATGLLQTFEYRAWLTISLTLCSTVL